MSPQPTTAHQFADFGEYALEQLSQGHSTEAVERLLVDRGLPERSARLVVAMADRGRKARLAGVSTNPPTEAQIDAMMNVAIVLAWRGDSAEKIEACLLEQGGEEFFSHMLAQGMYAEATERRRRSQFWMTLSGALLLVVCGSALAAGLYEVLDWSKGWYSVAAWTGLPGLALFLAGVWQYVTGRTVHFR